MRATDRVLPAMSTALPGLYSRGTTHSGEFGAPGSSARACSIGQSFRRANDIMGRLLFIPANSPGTHLGPQKGGVCEN